MRHHEDDPTLARVLRRDDRANHNMRPGDPKETPPHPVPTAPSPELRQEVPAPLTARATRRGTPVLGTGQPARALSGRLRHLAYQVPEHRKRRWLLLLLADRIDVWEGRILGPPHARRSERGGVGAALVGGLAFVGRFVRG